MKKNNIKRLGLVPTLAVLLLLGTAPVSVGASETETAEETASLQETDTEAAAANDTAGQVATAAEMTTVEEVLEDWMTPIPAAEVNDGTYDVKVNCSSSMFMIEKAALNVSGGKMEAVLTMGGSGYLYVYPGTAEEAAAAPEEDRIGFEEDEEGRHTFTIPVEALDDITGCAAYSKRKEKWYDRSLVFVSTSLPQDALKNADAGTTAADLSLADGEYLVDAVLEGGSGRTTVESPARLFVEDGEMTLEVIFSSKNYDYMIVDGEVYDPVNTEGNSTFLVPAAAFDKALPVIGDTIAMSTPHEIEYTITLDSETLEPAA